MNDYINREDAIKANENYVPYQRLGEDRQSYMNRILKELPSADVVKVRHGYWERDEIDFMAVCSCCKKVCMLETLYDKDDIPHVELYDYCPNCGAKMDGEEQEHE